MRTSSRMHLEMSVRKRSDASELPIRLYGIVASGSGSDSGLPALMWPWPAPKQKPTEEPPIPSNADRHRLFILATALIARGMTPDQAYKTALHYTTGAGRGQTWISALKDEDSHTALRS
jgi:hypothetical protein